MADPEATVVAYDSKTRKAVSDQHWGNFETFAHEKADFIYRYDPTMPDETALMLPEPYDRMSCRAETSSDKAPLPQGVSSIPITQAMRNALVAVLVNEPMRSTLHDGHESASIQGKRLFGQLTTAGFGPRAVYSEEAVADVTQMLRDAIRNGAPKVQNAEGGEISILDTKYMQVVGGLGAGGAKGGTRKIASTPQRHHKCATCAIHRLCQIREAIDLGSCSQH